MATAREATPGTQDLPTFQTVVQENEGIFGPLQLISTEGDNNIMTFLVGDSPDPEHRVILDIYTDHPDPKQGYCLVYAGICLVSGAAKRIAAYRKTEPADEAEG